MTGPDNITRPMLAESWEASDDLKTWTFHLRQGVMWHNGEELVAEHITSTSSVARSGALGSSNVGLSTFSAMLMETGETNSKGKPVRKAIENAVEVVDAHTVRFNLSKAVLSAPKFYYNYPTAIVHPSFKAPFSDNPIGTGPFTLAELVVDDRCVLKRITKTTDGKDFKYWGGNVYLDEIHYRNYDIENQVTALHSDEVDAIYEFSVDQLELARSVEYEEILSVPTAQNLCCRMQVDKPPFDDVRERQAIAKSVEQCTIVSLVFPDGGALGENHMVAPIHPEYFALPKLQRDIEKAKALLSEAGHANGITISITCGNTDGPWHQAIVEAMRAQMSEAGINLQIEMVPANRYWEIWTDVPFGATSWAHRPLGTMVLSLAFRTGVPWNESHYSNPEFDAALNDAEATFDVEARRAKMETIEKMLQDDAVVLQPLWRPVYTMATNKVHGYVAHPTRYHRAPRRSGWGDVGVRLRLCSSRRALRRPGGAHIKLPASAFS